MEGKSQTAEGLVEVVEMKQPLGFAQSEDAGKKKVTRRERFFWGELEQVVPWARLGAAGCAALSTGPTWTAARWAWSACCASIFLPAVVCPGR